MSLVKSCMRLFAVCSSIVAASSVGTANTTDTITSTIEDIAVTGAVWSTISPEADLQLGAAGLRDTLADSPMTTDTRIFIGSITKSLVATGALRLISDSKLTLDTPVSSLLPDLDIQNSWRSTAPITIRHLLDHTAGLAGARLRQGFDNRATPDTPLVEAFSGAPIKVRSKPGERASYSNMGYTLLGMAIEAVTGQRYEDYLQAELLVPLGMTDSSFHFHTPETGPHFDDRLAWGHTPNGSHAVIRPILMRPAGQFTSTAADMAKFMTFLLGDGTVNEQPFIRADLMRTRGTPQTTIAAQSGLKVGYSLGLARVELGGSMALCHDGQIQGYLAQMCVFPADNKGFFFSVNMNNPRADLRQIADALTQSLAPTQLEKADAQPLPADITDWAGIYLPAPFRNGWSALPEILTRPVSLVPKDGKLVIASGMRPPQEARHLGGHLFAVSDWAGASHALARDDTGAPLLVGPSATYEKTSPLMVHGHRASMLFGLVAMLWVIASIPVVLIRSRKGLLKHPMVFLMGAALMNLMVIFLLAGRPLDGIGAFNLTTGFIALGTVLLPVAAAISLLQLRNWRERPKMRIVHGVAAIAVLQLCGVLAYWGWMPLMTWTL